MRRIGDGDARAFDELFARYRDPLYRYCWGITGSAADAEEAVQTTMLNAHRALGAGAGPLRLRPWLYRIARNACLNVVRDRPRWAPLDPAAADPRGGPEAASESRERLEGLRRDLAALDDDRRTALVLRELAGLSHREIADAIGPAADAATAKRLIREAREALADLAEGRDLACAEVRRTISDGDGRVLRSRRLRSHLRSCDDCAGFRRGIARRGADLAAIAGVPALPAAGTLAGASGTAVVGGAEGGLTALVGEGVAAKVATVVAVVALGGGAAVVVPSVVGPDAGPSHAAATPAVAAVPAAAAPSVVGVPLAVPRARARAGSPPARIGEPPGAPEVSVLTLTPAPAAAPAPDPPPTAVPAPAAAAPPPAPAAAGPATPVPRDAPPAAPEPQPVAGGTAPGAPASNGGAGSPARGGVPAGTLPAPARAPAEPPGRPSGVAPPAGAGPPAASPPAPAPPGAGGARPDGAGTPSPAPPSAGPPAAPADSRPSARGPATP